VSALRTAYLHELGVTAWRRRQEAAEAPAEGAAAASMPAAAGAVVSRVADDRNGTAALDWDTLERAVSSCTRCPLHATRRQAVFGVGDRHAPLLVVGEAPGADEDRLGEPFVGRAGQLLNAMLRAIGLAREQVYIANVLKCRPPNNRDPKPEESAACTPYLSRQITLLQPRAMLALGRISAQWLLQSDAPVGRLRGRVVTLETWDVPLVVSYHPAYLLRSPAAKAMAWQDLLLVQNLLKKPQ
jgi:DNA polymerase